MLTNRGAAVFLVLLTTAVSCAPAPPAAPSPQEQGAAPSSVQRTLIMIGGRAPESIAARPLRQIQGAGQPNATFRAFNA